MIIKKKQKNFNRIIVILGMPRSGTTLVAAIFDANTDTCVCYEPWNRQKKNPPNAQISPSDLAKHYKIPIGKSNTFVIKETAISPDSLEWVGDFIKYNEKNYDIRIVWTVRSYSHTYLSLIEKGREWWGNEKMAVNEGTYNRWVKRASLSTKTMSQMYLMHPGIIYSYEALVESPKKIIRSIMAACNLPYQDQLLNYHKHAKANNIRGDLNLQKEPTALSNEHLLTRESQWQQHKELLATSENDPIRIDLDALHTFIHERGYLVGDKEYRALIAEILNDLYNRKPSPE
jgi:hypothetical protein